MESLFLARWKSYLRYLDFPGKAPNLVFLHGLGCASSSDFPRVIANPALAGHRSVLVDFFGHGFSDRPFKFSYTLEDHAKTVAELLDHLSLSKVVLFGHSMGGSIAITLAAIRTDLVSRLIVAEGNLDPGGGVVSTGIAAQTEQAFVTSGHKALLRKALDLGWPTFMGTSQICASYGLYRSALSLVKGTQPTIRERFLQMTIPRTYVYGENTLKAPSPQDPDPKVLEKEGVQVVTIQRAGHAMMSDNPAGVAKAIKRIMTQRRRSRGQ
jgi:pimeloyl-ACP methyl ester carboxylesterase